MKRFFQLLRMLWKGYQLEGKVSEIEYDRNMGYITHREFLMEKYALVYPHRSKMVRLGFRRFYEEFNEFFE